MAAKIRVRGLPDALDVSSELAERIKADWENDTIPNSRKIAIGDWSGTKGDIRSIYNERRVSDDQDDAQDKINDEYRKFRAQRLKLTPADRAKSLALFQIIYWGFTRNKDIPHDVKTKAIELETKFYELNHGRIHPDPEIFKEMFRGMEMNKFALPVIENIIRADRQYVPTKSKWGIFAE